MITSAKFQNFKALRDVKIDFQSRMTVLVGPNGCGKTSIFQAIQLLTTLGNLEHPGLGISAAILRIANEKSLANFSHWQDSCSLNHNDLAYLFSISGNLGIDKNYHAKISFPYQKIDPVLLDFETPKSNCYCQLHSYSNNEWKMKNIETVGQYEFYSPTRFDRAMFLRFVASRMVAPQLVEQYPPQLQEDGTGLANVLMHLYSKYPSRFEQLQSAFCRVIRGAKAIRFDKSPVEGKPYFGDVLLIDYDHIQGVAAKHLSSGTLYGLGILTAIFNPESPSVILLDDLDNGLHPKAQMELLDVLQEVLKEQPQLQIIATSHSPYILDRLEPNEVRILNLDDEGCTVCRSLEEAPEFDRWKESMTPGEFWSHFGDDWVKKPKAPTEFAAS